MADYDPSRPRQPTRQNTRTPYQPDAPLPPPSMPQQHSLGGEPPAMPEPDEEIITILPGNADDDRMAVRPGAVPQGLVRRRTRTEDKFYIPLSKVPRGWTYEWKRESCYGQPDTDHQTNLRENYWTPVPARRHPEMMPTGFEGSIKKDGMVLMERPAYLTEQARQEDFDYAMGEVGRATAALGQSPDGQFTRAHPSVERISGVKRTYGPM